MSQTYTLIENKTDEKVSEAVNLHTMVREHGAQYIISVAEAASKQVKKIEGMLKENESYIDAADLKDGTELIRQYNLLIQEIIRMCVEDAETLTVIKENQDIEELITWFDEINRVELVRAMANRCINLKKMSDDYKINLEKKYGSLSVRSMISEAFVMIGGIFGGLGLLILLGTGVGAIGVAIASGAAAVGSSFASAATIGGISFGVGAAFSTAGVMLDRDSLKRLVETLVEASVRLQALGDELAALGGLLSAYKRMSRRLNFDFNRLGRIIDGYSRVLEVVKR